MYLQEEGAFISVFAACNPEISHGVYFCPLKSHWRHWSTGKTVSVALDEERLYQLNGSSMKSIDVKHFVFVNVIQVVTARCIDFRVINELPSTMINISVPS